MKQISDSDLSNLWEPVAKFSWTFSLRLGDSAPWRSSVLTRHTLLDKSRNRGRVRALTLQLLPHSLIHKCGALNNLNASNLIAQWLDKTTNECLLLVIDLLAGTFLSRGES